MYNSSMQMKFSAPKVPQKTIRGMQRYWLTIAFFIGFLVDTITLNRVDQLFDNLILLSYVIIATIALLVLYAGAAGKLPEQWIPRARQYAPLFVQYAFGGLLSGMLIFYGRSGAWEESWPFLLVILAVIYGNETIQKRTSRLIFNLAIYFIGIFSWVVLLIPVVTGWMGPWIFVGSGLIALFLMYLFVQALFRIIPNFMALQMRKIVFTLGAIFATFNFLYFTNIIPPIPLSLKDVGIYHSVVRFENGDYQVKYEEGAWWQFFRDSDSEFHPIDNGPVFCFARVFAPTRLETDIYHHWEQWDETADEWRSHSRISYAIEGGRGDGFRGYTLIQNYSDGDWRCSVETGRGQVLGREEFEINSDEAASELVTAIQ